MMDEDLLRPVTFLIGISLVAVGFFLVKLNRKKLERVIASGPDDRTLRFETKKYRRRFWVGALLAAAGCLLASLGWVVDPKVFAILIAVIMTLLLVIMAVACLDMVSVGIVSIMQADREKENELVQEALRRRAESSHDPSGDS